MNVASCVLAVFCLQAAAAAIVPVGNSRQLFLDRTLVAEADGIRFQLHHPQPREIVLSHDVPHEGNCSCYATVLKDGDIYRLYYNGAHCSAYGVIGTARKPHPDLTCIAESKDGIVWIRPTIGEVEFNGSKENNILPIPARWTHCFTPFIDANPICPASERYKAFAFDHGTPHKLFGFVSADGIHWRMASEKPLLTDGNFDSQNLGFYDTVRGCYVAYYRKPWPNKRRGVATATSNDFIHWTEHGLIHCSHEADLYTNAILRYPRAPQYLLGFPMLFEDFRTYSGNFAAGVGDGGLLVGRNGVDFTLNPQAFFRPGMNRERWYNRCNYAAWGFVETPGPFPGSPDELSFYYSEGYYEGREVKLRRCTLRKDGFISATADAEEGSLLTVPLTFSEVPKSSCKGTSVPSRLLAPLTIESGGRIFHRGNRYLRVSRPIALEIPGSRELGHEATFAIQTDAVSHGGERRFFSSFDKQPGGNRFCFHMYVSPDRSHYKDSLLRCEFTGCGRAEFKGEKFVEKIMARTDHHFAATYDHGRICLYMDGEKVASSPANVSDKPLSSELGDIRIGNDYPPNGLFNSPFIGYADDILILRRVLSAEEIASLARMGAENTLDATTEKGVLYTFESDTDAPLVDVLSVDGCQNAAPLRDMYGRTMLLLNCATAARGMVKVEIQDAQTGLPVPGFADSDCETIFDDSLERSVSWKGRTDLSDLAGRPIKLRFRLRDADLYGFRFGMATK